MERGKKTAEKVDKKELKYSRFRFHEMRISKILNYMGQYQDQTRRQILDALGLEELE